jgi:nitrite reductase (cytochrome c-552)
MGFHAPAEAARILGESMSFARQGQIALRDPTFEPVVDAAQAAPRAAAQGK